MFLIPEILWGLCGNFLYNMIRLTFSLGESNVFYNLFKFPDSSQSKLLLNLSLLIQLVGLSGLFYFILKIKNINLIKYLLLFIIFVLIVTNLFFLIFIFNFNPQIG